MFSKILVVSILSWLTIETTAQCNQQDKLIGQKCYQVNNKLVSRTDASNICSSQGYHLMSIHSREESQAIGEIARHSFRKFEAEYWIGLKKDSHGFSWDDASPVDYLFWVPENVFMFDYVSVFVINDQWHSSPDHSRFPFICSYNAKFSTTTSQTSTVVPKTKTTITSVPPKVTSTTTVLPTTTLTSTSTFRTPTSTYTSTSTSTLPTTSRSTPTSTSTSSSTSTTTATVPLNSCQVGDITLQGRCFSFNRQKLSRENARIECSRIGKTLAILDNISQSTFLSSYAQNQFDTSFASFWIGLYRDNSSTPFYWPDQSRIMFSNWASGYPFDGELYVAQDISNTKWKTSSSDTLLFSVCSGKVQ